MPKVLLIGTPDPTLTAIATMLETARYEVIAVQESRTVLTTVTNERPDIIICDLLTSAAAGKLLLKLISHYPELRIIPFLALTPKSDWNEMRTLMDLGADDYLHRNTETSELLLSVESHLNKKNRVLANGVDDSTPQQAMPEEAHQITELMHWAAKARDTRKFRKGQVIYAEGDRSSYLFFLMKGAVKCSVKNDEGKRFITNLLGEGDLFGFYTLFSNCKHVDTAEAMNEVEVSLIPEREFVQSLGKECRFSKEIAGVLNKIIAERDRSLLSLAYDSARKRVANGLLRVREKLINGHLNGSAIDITRTDLANICGVTRESTIRILSDFKEERLIDICEGRIVVLQDKKLRELPN